MDHNGGRGDDYVHGFLALRMFFDQFVESCRVGLRKPDPNIYMEACKRLDVQPHEVSYYTANSHSITHLLDMVTTLSLSSHHVVTVSNR